MRRLLCWLGLHDWRSPESYRTERHGVTVHQHVYRECWGCWKRETISRYEMPPEQVEALTQKEAPDAR